MRATLNTKQLSEFYERELQAKGFYAHALWRAKHGGSKFVQRTDYDGSFFRGIEPRQLDNPGNTAVKDGDWRYDMPAWFSKSSVISEVSCRIMVVGREPRASDDDFNVMRSKGKNEDRVFGVAFGADRWVKGANIKGGHQMMYAKAFDKLIKRNWKKDWLIVFTDAVKKFEVIMNMDKKAQEKFYEYFENDEFGKTLLLKEIELIRPDIIIALSGPSYKAFHNPDIIKTFPNIILFDNATVYREHMRA